MLILYSYFFSRLMKFNWIGSNATKDEIKRFCIDLEYELRSKITYFLMLRLENECDGDFSCFHFDVNVDSMQVTISDKTPKEYTRKIQSDFDLEIRSLSY
ncbi:hypothetical protein WIW50_15145 [Flavobacteriaceae bacterium 3-367]|uniref:hypothetical protein n=1 Tax=Eudoraea algarum TaxID=3417568 RepID=UPI0032881663